MGRTFQIKRTAKAEALSGPAGGWWLVQLSEWEGEAKTWHFPASRVTATLSTALRVELTGTAERTSEGVGKKGEDDNRNSE